VRRAPIFLLLALLMGTASAGRALGAGYGFEIPDATVTVNVQKDGSAVIHYRLRFKCARGRRPIDVVDIGMPTAKHEALGATIDERSIPAHRIGSSEYVQNAYEVHLDSGAIGPGREGVFEFTGRSYGMVWQDTTNPRQASFRFAPTWFDSRFLRGRTTLTLVYVLPIPAKDLPEVANRILWHRKSDAGWKKGLSSDGKFAAVVWKRKLRLDRRHVFGASFPKKYVDRVLSRTIWDVFYDWFRKSYEVQFGSGLVLLIAFSVIFFMTTRGTGCALWGMLTLGMIGGMVWSPAFHLWMYPAVGGLSALAIWARRRRRRYYFPAELCIEGGGVKRGLTAVEAAVMLELPFNKILTMIVFALAKKGVLRIAGKQPLSVKVRGHEKTPGVWLLPGDAPVKLWPYEPDFLDAFRSQSLKSVEEMRLKGPFENLIKLVKGSMIGFDLEKTRDYYRYVMRRAWKQIRAEADYEVRFARVDKNLDWLMLDDDWGTSMLGLADTGYRYHPWWWHGEPHGSYSSLVGDRVAGAGDVTSPEVSFTDVANSITGRLEAFSNDLTRSLDSVAGGEATVDLSSFDKFTSEALEAMSSGSGGGGGGFGGGCACAGCACACACAGGGR
jgi:hypothetical protein